MIFNISGCGAGQTGCEQRKKNNFERIDGYKKRTAKPDQFSADGGRCRRAGFVRQKRKIFRDGGDRRGFYHSCDPQILLDELEITLGADDRCLAQTGGATSSAVFSDLGRITIPGRSADNVIYFVLNNKSAAKLKTLSPTACRSFPATFRASRLKAQR